MLNRLGRTNWVVWVVMGTAFLYLTGYLKLPTLETTEPWVMIEPHQETIDNLKECQNKLGECESELSNYKGRTKYPDIQGTAIWQIAVLVVLGIVGILLYKFRHLFMVKGNGKKKREK